MQFRKCLYTLGVNHDYHDHKQLGTRNQLINYDISANIYIYIYATEYDSGAAFEIEQRWRPHGFRLGMNAMKSYGDAIKVFLEVSLDLVRLWYDDIYQWISCDELVKWFISCKIYNNLEHKLDPTFPVYVTDKLNHEYYGDEEVGIWLEWTWHGRSAIYKMLCGCGIDRKQPDSGFIPVP